jgi:hypothetical protein
MSSLLKVPLIAVPLVLCTLMLSPPLWAQPDDEGADEEAPIVWQVDAQLRPRAEARTNHRFGLQPDQLNYPGKDTFNTITQRSRLGAHVSADQVSAYVQAQHVAEWGTTGGDALSDPTLFVHQAWLRYGCDDAWYVQAGRQELAYGDHRVLGSVGWSQVGRAWDAARFGVQPNEVFGVDLFAGRYAAGVADPQLDRDVSLFDRDAYLLGAYVTLREFAQPALDEIDVYALYDVQIDDLSDDQPNHRNLVGLGARAAGTWSVVDGVVEGMYQLGSRCLTEADGPDCTDETVDLRGWFVDAELGALVYEPNSVRLFAAFSQASGDDPDTADTDESYFQFYPTAHKWLGYMDIIGGRTNIQEVRGGLSAKLGPVQLRESAHYFRRLWPQAESVGLEFDTTASATLHEHLGVDVGHGLFVPSEGMSRDGEPEGVANWFFVQMNAVF